MSARRVLVVAYNFPPVAGTGIERTLKHVTYLPERGWQPVVVAPANPAYRLVDRATIERVPAGTEVLRAPLLEPAHARLLLRRLWPPDGGASGNSPRDGRASTTGGRPGGSSLRGALNAAWAAIIPALFFPDEQLLWAPSAAFVGWRAHRRSPVDLIYSSAPPFSSHLAAGLLKRLIGVPWVADFRDPWIGNTFARQLGATHRRLQAGLERWMVSRADRSVFATQRLRDRYAARYPDLADRFLVIPNGYDLADLQSTAEGGFAPMPVEDGTFRLVYTGSIYGAEELPILLDGVERLLTRRPEFRARLRIQLVGWLNAVNQAIAARRLPALEPVVRHLGQVSRAQAIAHLAGADAALLLMAPGRDQDVGTKAYEYIGLDKPILAVTPPGEARAVLAELDWGVVVDPTPDGVASGLERIIEAPPRERQADPRRIYERRTLSRRLAAVLDEVVDQGVVSG